MANINPNGIDLTTGQGRTLTPVDTLLVTSGNLSLNGPAPNVNATAATGTLSVEGATGLPFARVANPTLAPSVVVLADPTSDWIAYVPNTWTIQYTYVDVFGNETLPSPTSNFSIPTSNNLSPQVTVSLVPGAVGAKFYLHNTAVAPPGFFFFAPTYAAPTVYVLTSFPTLIRWVTPVGPGSALPSSNSTFFTGMGFDTIIQPGAASDNTTWSGSIRLKSAATGTGTLLVDTIIVDGPTGTASAPGAGLDSEQWGLGSAALSDNATAVGQAANASGLGSTALGQGSTAGGAAAIAVGTSTTANGDNSVAIGATANDINCVGIGINSTVTGPDSVVIGGNSSNSSTSQDVYIGANIFSEGGQGVAIGANAQPGLNNDFVGIGYNVNIGGSKTVVIGWEAHGGGDITIGASAAGGFGNITIGKNSDTSGVSAEQHIILGSNCNINSTNINSIIIGSHSSTQGGDNNVNLIGSGLTNLDNDGTTILSNVLIIGGNSVVDPNATSINDVWFGSGPTGDGGSVPVTIHGTGGASTGFTTGSDISLAGGKGFNPATDHGGNVHLQVALDGSSRTLRDSVLVHAPDGFVAISGAPGGATTPTSTLDIQGSAGFAFTTKSFADTPVTMDGTARYWYFDATGGNIDVTLPDATTCPNRSYKVKKLDASANLVTFTPAVGTIEGAGTFTLSAQFQFQELANDGTNWWLF